jgi:hypothetical protein
MRRGCLLALGLGLVLVSTTCARGIEILVVSTPPAVVYDVPAFYVLVDFRMRTDPPRVDVRLAAKMPDGSCAKDSHGDCQTVAAAYTDEDAVKIINTLNTADLSSNSLNKRVLNRMVTDGLVPAGASVAGTPGYPSRTPTATATATPVVAATSTAPQTPAAE